VHINRVDVSTSFGNFEEAFLTWLEAKKWMWLGVVLQSNSLI